MKWLFSLLFFAVATTVSFGKTLTLSEHNTVVLRFQVNENTVSQVYRQAAALPGHGPIYLVLDTPGGSVFAGQQLISALRNLNRPVHTVSVFAASMGFQTVQGLGKRYITNEGTLMSHRAWTRIAGEINGELDSRLNFIKRAIVYMEQVSAKRAGISLKTYQTKIADEYWCIGAECVRDNFADAAVNVRCDVTMKGITTESFTFQAFFGDVTVELEYNKCPVVSGHLSMKLKKAGHDMSVNDLVIEDQKKLKALLAERTRRTPIKVIMR